MFRKTFALAALLAIAACASAQPRVIQASADAMDISLTAGMATQIEMPSEGRVQSVVVGNPNLVTAEQAGDVVNLIGKGGAGETNLIIRFREEGGKTKVYQYRVTVQQ